MPVCASAGRPSASWPPIGVPDAVVRSRMGLTHGAYCLGCCWILMALLFFGGVMNLWWVGGLAACVLLEKTLPIGHWLAYAVGGALVVWGVCLVASG